MTGVVIRYHCCDTSTGSYIKKTKRLVKVEVTLNESSLLSQSNRVDLHPPVSMVGASAVRYTTYYPIYILDQSAAQQRVSTLEIRVLPNVDAHNESG